MGLAQFGAVLLFISRRNTAECMHKTWIPIPFPAKKTLGIIEHPYINSYPLRTLVAKTHPIQMKMKMKMKISTLHQASNVRPPTSVLAQK